MNTMHQSAFSVQFILHVDPVVVKVSILLLLQQPLLYIYTYIDCVGVCSLLGVMATAGSLVNISCYGLLKNLSL